MALTNTAFSSANSTLTIYENSTDVQKTAMAALQVKVNAAAQLALTDPIKATANKQTAFLEYVGEFQTPRTVDADLTVTSGSASTAAQAAGYYSGTWTYGTTSAVTATGTWASTKATATTVEVEMNLITGVLPAAATITTAQSGVAVGFAFTNTSTNSLGTISSYSAIVADSASAGISVGKITAMGDTGVTSSTISAKLLNEAGTFKGKGSSDQGELSVDFLRVPADLGQIAMFQAQEDMSQHANRVFCINHSNGNVRFYFIGMVSTIKTTRGAIDAIVNAKGTILIQDGAVEVSY